VLTRELLHNQVPDRPQRLEVFEQDFIGRDGHSERLLNEGDQFENRQRIDQAFADDVGIGLDGDRSLPAGKLLREEPCERVEDLLVGIAHVVWKISVCGRLAAN
jgi:hypothetical protein